MKRVFTLLLFIAAAVVANGQAKFAGTQAADPGPDQTICEGTSVTLGRNTDDPKLCFSWKASPADPSLKTTTTAKVTVKPTQTTTYTLSIISDEFSYVSAARVKVTVVKNAVTTITWGEADYAADNVNENSTTVDKPFTLEYTACADVPNNVWHLVVTKISGNVTIRVHTGGSRNAITDPPKDEAEAKAAVTDMKGYFKRGRRGDWHTEAASKVHELYHYSEWKCSSEHYWPDTEKCLEALTVAYDANPDLAKAIAALKPKADEIKEKFRKAAKQYWISLGDAAGDRPYAAGQLELNKAIESVQDLAKKKGWTVPAGVDTPSTADPCYKAFDAYVCN